MSATNNNARGGNPHEVNAYNIGRVAYSVEALDIIARHVGELYGIKPASVFVKMMTALEEGHHPYAAGIKFAVERMGKAKEKSGVVRPPAPEPAKIERKVGVVVDSILNTPEVVVDYSGVDPGPHDYDHDY